MAVFSLHILAAERAFYEGECESLTVPAYDGLYGIKAYHSNLIAALSPGMITYTAPGKAPVTAFTSGGMVKVENNVVYIFADTIELPEEMDLNAAKRAAEAAREEMLQKKGIEDYYRAQIQLAKALGRLKTGRTPELG